MHTCVCRLLLFALVFEEADDARLSGVVNGVFLFWPSRTIPFGLAFCFFFYWFCRCLALLCTSRLCLLLLASLLGRLCTSCCNSASLLIGVDLHVLDLLALICVHIEEAKACDLVTEAAFSIVKHMAACPHKCEARAA